MVLADKSIAIVGGGPGGLTLAKLLQQKGANVKVFERDINKHARVQGSPLDLHENSGLAALDKANLLGEFKKNFLPGADKKLIVNQHAEVFFSDHETNLEKNFGETSFRPEIDRGALRKILLESLTPETVVWNSHFCSMEKQHHGWQLKFKNGTSVYADIVIAADGANSKIRPYITNIKAFYSGITMVEFSVTHVKTKLPSFANLLNGGKVMAFGNEKCILGGQKGNGDIGFYTSFKTGENWSVTNGLDYTDKTQLVTWFKATYPEWSEIWVELIEHIETPAIPRPIYCVPLTQTWEALPNLTLLGDAAHVMPPFAGEGVNMAMLDALELSEHLIEGSFNTVQEAFASYENTMRKRAARAAKESLENGEKMHAPEAMENIVGFFKEHH